MRHKARRWWLTLTAAALTFAMFSAFSGARHHRQHAPRHHQEQSCDHGHHRDYRGPDRYQDRYDYRYDDRYQDRYDYRYEDRYDRRYDRRDYRDRNYDRREYRDYGPRPW